MDPYKEEIFVIFIEDIFVSPTIFALPCVFLLFSEPNSKSKTQYYDYYYGGVDVDEKMSSIGSAPLTILYFGENLINPPSNPTEWSYFSVIVIHTRAFAFSPSNSPDAFAFRQKINGVWQNWIYG